MGKITLKNVKNALKRDEMREVVGGCANGNTNCGCLSSICGAWCGGVCSPDFRTFFKF